MANSILRLASALEATLALAGGGLAQPPDRRGGPPDPFGRRGPRDGLERVVDDLKLSGEKRDTALEAVRAYQDNVRRLMELSGASLLLQMKDVLSPEEFKKVAEAASRFRGSRPGPRRPAEDDVVERILSFDKNKDGKI